MKNLLCLHKKTDIYDYLTSKFQSPHFKTAGIARRMYEQNILDFCNEPRIFCEYSDPALEHDFFYSWLNILPERDNSYDILLVHDLYYLHEMTHMSMLDVNRKKNISYPDWRYKMIENEITSSLFTEAYIYCGLIGEELRKDSFDHEIWIDDLYKYAVDRYIPNLRELRYRAYCNPKNELEIQLFKYMQNNHRWCEIWRKDYLAIENMLYHRQFLPAEDQNDFLLEFLSNVMEDDIPYKDNAIEFKANTNGWHEIK